MLKFFDFTDESGEAAFSTPAPAGRSPGRHPQVTQVSAFRSLAALERSRGSQGCAVRGEQPEKRRASGALYAAGVPVVVYCGLTEVPLDVVLVARGPALHAVRLEEYLHAGLFFVEVLR